MSSLAKYFTFWRTTVVRDREIVDAVVHPDHRGPSPELEAALESWPGARYWAEGDGAGRLILIRTLARPAPERWWLHVALFAATFLTVWVGGAIIAGAVPPTLPPIGSVLSPGPGLMDWLSDLRPGLGFAGGLMAILLVHELGHYVRAKRYGIDTSPPYFLPWPPYLFLNLIGTFGAFIRLRSPIVDRRQLVDIAAAGPWAGFVTALVVLAIGLPLSEVTHVSGPTPQVLILAPGLGEVYLGDSPVMYLMRWLFVGEGTVELHPIAFAGWFGIFVTMLNLMPLGQLDGGHVLYAIFGDRHRTIAPLLFLGVVLLAVAWRFWLLWALLVLILGRGRLSHPPVLDRHRPLSTRRRLLGWATVLLLAATFSPTPLHW